jgi:hypothetical protein
MDKNIEKTLFELEAELQKPDVRKSIEKLNGLISDEFREITSLGTVKNKQDCFVSLPAAPEIKFVMTDFSVRELAPNLMQTFFKTEKTEINTGKVSHSIRNSIWINENGKWKMIFHQGTPTSE